MPGEIPEPNVVEYAARHADTDDEGRQAPACADQTAAQALTATISAAGAEAVGKPYGGDFASPRSKQKV
jgi:hypothetical protein